MHRIAPQCMFRMSLFCLSLLPGFAVAGNSAPEDYLAGKPLFLEVRSCDCRATETEGSPLDLSTDFLNESALLKVGVSTEEEGFVSSNGVAVGYELKPAPGSPEQFHFSYAVKYETGNESSTVTGVIRLTEGEWVRLYGSQNESEAGLQHSSVVVRLTTPGGS